MVQDRGGNAAVAARAATRAARTARSGRRDTRPGAPVLDVRGLLAVADPAQRSAGALGIQRSAGNRALCTVLRQAVGPATERRADPAPGVTVQRTTAVQRAKEHEKPLSDIQGRAMSALLPALAALEPAAARADAEAAAFVGGPRLVLAMRAVQARGTPWSDFAAAHSAALAALPPDQLNDVLTYLGGPRDVRVFGKEKFGGRYDAVVDPAGGTVTLVLRVAFGVQPDRSFDPGDPRHNDPAAWRLRSTAVLAQFRSGFAAEVQSVLSGKGSITAACPKGKHTTFTAALRVEVVDDPGAAHRTVVIHPKDAAGRGGATHSEDPAVPINLKEGTLGRRTRKAVRSNRTGTAPVEKDVTHSTAAHETGHALGLEHPVCKGGEERCYGTTMDQYEDVMGGGDTMQVLKAGGAQPADHDDFAPWEAAAREWATTALFPGALGPACNTWKAK